MIDNDALNSLASKLDALDLSGDESQVLELLYTRAAGFEADVEGFAFRVQTIGLSATALKLGSGIGSIGLGGKPEFKFGGKPEHGGGGGKPEFR